MNRGPVGLRIERPDVKWQGLGLGIHLMLWRGSALWKIVRHLEDYVKMAGRRKIGRECEESTKSQPREGRKSRSAVKAQISRKTRGKQAPSGGNKKRDTETKFRSVQNVRNAKVFANRTTKWRLERKKTRKSKEENDLEREGEKFRARGSEENRA
mgnify:CR=1 FL=1